MIELKRNAIEKIIREGDPISGNDAVALVGRIRNLYLSDAFDGHAAYLDLLAGECLRLKEGQTAGEVFTVMAMLKANPESREPVLRQIINIAVPAELKIAFGVESAQWLYDRSEDFARDYARASRLFDGGDWLPVADNGNREHPMNVLTIAEVAAKVKLSEIPF